MKWELKIKKHTPQQKKKGKLSQASHRRHNKEYHRCSWNAACNGHMVHYAHAFAFVCVCLYGSACILGHILSRLNVQCVQSTAQGDAMQRATHPVPYLKATISARRGKRLPNCGHKRGVHKVLQNGNHCCICHSCAALNRKSGGAREAERSVERKRRLLPDQSLYSNVENVVNACIKNGKCVSLSLNPLCAGSMCCAYAAANHNAAADAAAVRHSLSCTRGASVCVSCNLERLDLHQHAALKCI